MSPPAVRAPLFLINDSPLAITAVSACSHLPGGPTPSELPVLLCYLQLFSLVLALEIHHQLLGATPGSWDSSFIS